MRLESLCHRPPLPRMQAVSRKATGRVDFAPEHAYSTGWLPLVHLSNLNARSDLKSVSHSVEHCFPQTAVQQALHMLHKAA